MFAEALQSFQDGQFRVYNMLAYRYLIQCNAQLSFLAYLKGQI